MLSVLAQYKIRCHTLELLKFVYAQFLRIHEYLLPGIYILNNYENHILENFKLSQKIPMKP